MWAAKGISNNVERRMGWRQGETTVGTVGKAVQTIGMARVRHLIRCSKYSAHLVNVQATYDAVLAARPNDRPVIVSRSGVPGIQAFAHATWSGDNSTTWKALAWGTKVC